MHILGRHPPQEHWDPLLKGKGCHCHFQNVSIRCSSSELSVCLDNRWREKRKESREKKRQVHFLFPCLDQQWRPEKDHLGVLPFFLDTVLHPSIFSSLCNLSFNYKTTTLDSNRGEHKMKASQSHYGILMDHTLIILARQSYLPLLSTSFERVGESFFYITFFFVFPFVLSDETWSLGFLSWR